MKEAGARKLRECAATGGRLLLGAVFLYAGVIKAAAPAEEFAYAIESYRVLPDWLALAAAYTLPWIEIGLGAMLLAAVYLRPALAAAGALLAVFEALLLYVIVRKIPVASCGCFGSALAMSPAAEFIMNLLLLFAAAVVCKGGGAADLGRKGLCAPGSFDP